MREKYHKLNAEKFVRCWQKAKNVPHFIKLYGWPKSSAAAAAAAVNLRRMGVPLKSMRNGGGRPTVHDYKKLAKLAKECA